LSERTWLRVLADFLIRSAPTLGLISLVHPSLLSSLSSTRSSHSLVYSLVYSLSQSPVMLTLQALTSVNTNAEQLFCVVIPITFLPPASAGSKGKGGKGEEEDDDDDDAEEEEERRRIRLGRLARRERVVFI